MMVTTMKVAVWATVIVAFVLAVQLPVRITSGAWQLHVPKVAAQSLSTYLVVGGLAGSAVAVALFLAGVSARLPVAAVLGLVAALLAASYIQHATAPHDALADTFGPGWADRIPAEERDAMLPGRWQWALPGGPEPRWEQDVVYASVPGGSRELLADVWQPPHGVNPSGLALVYVHGGYYEMLDKDSGTRPLFRHLARQGHVVIDLSYRLVDEADIFGMVGDVKRGIAWLKDHAEGLGVDPDRIVVAGASSGGNLALLAAYTAGHPQLTPADVQGDTSVRAAVAYYGVHDWRAFSRLDDADTDLTPRLLGGTFDEVPDRYDLASPITHVDADTPATLLFQGLHDVAHLVAANRNLARALADFGVPVTNVELARTDHSFDLILGRITPPGIAAVYDLERFLALVNHDPARAPGSGMPVGSEASGRARPGFPHP